MNLVRTRSRLQCSPEGLRSDFSLGSYTMYLGNVGSCRGEGGPEKDSLGEVLPTERDSSLAPGQQKISALLSGPVRTVIRPSPQTMSKEHRQRTNSLRAVLVNLTSPALGFKAPSSERLVCLFLTFFGLVPTAMVLFCLLQPSPRQAQHSGCF